MTKTIDSSHITEVREHEIDQEPSNASEIAPLMQETQSRIQRP